MISVPENVATKTIHQIERQFNKMDVPIKLFKKLLYAAKGLDFTKLNDPVIKSRYLTSRLKVQEHFKAILYMDIYDGSEMYTAFINLMITLFAIFDALIQGRLYITDIAMQDSSIVSEFLDSYGFEINRILSNDVNIDIATNVYGIIRKKGTVDLLSILLNDIGCTYFCVDEYDLTMLNGKFVLAPDTVYKSDKKMTSPAEYIELDKLNDPLWTISVDELKTIFKHSIDIDLEVTSDV